MIKRSLTIFICIFILAFPTTVVAAVPYRSYVQVFYDDDHWEQLGAPAAFVPQREYDFATVGGLRWPSDIHSTPDGTRLFVVDTGNNRIIECHYTLVPLRILDSFDYNGETHTFNEPQGVFYNEHTGLLYVADTRNGRIVSFDNNFNAVRILGAPEIPLPEGMYTFEYLPSKLVIDRGGRMYVIAGGFNRGIIELCPEGEFVGFFGAPTVEVSGWQRFLRVFMSAEQRRRMINFVPTEFDNFHINDDGFIFTASTRQMAQVISALSDNIQVPEDLLPIMKLNARGTNVLRYDDFPPLGDLFFGVLTQFIDVMYIGNGMMAALDSNMGRIFVYDGDGQFLYMFGGGSAPWQARGSQLGTFTSAIALDRIGDTFFVLDAGTSTVTSFIPTEYGAAVERSAIAFFNGDLDAAYAAWAEILTINSNYHQAIEGIARILVHRGYYREALDMFRSINSNGSHASMAFSNLRKQTILDAAPLIFVSLLVLIVVFVAFKFAKLYRHLKKEAWEWQQRRTT